MPLFAEKIHSEGGEMIRTPLPSVFVPYVSGASWGKKTRGMERQRSCWRERMKKNQTCGAN